MGFVTRQPGRERGFAPGRPRPHGSHATQAPGSRGRPTSGEASLSRDAKPGLLRLPHHNAGMSTSAPPQRFKPSVTVAALIERQGRYLMVEEQTPEGLRINQPAGHLEQGESPLEAVVREVREETAHSFTPQSLLGLYMARFQRPATGEDITYLRMAFSGVVGEPLPGLALDEGILRWLWLSPREVAQAEREGRTRSALVWQCVQDHLRGQRHPLDLIHCADSLWRPDRYAAAGSATP